MSEDSRAAGRPRLAIVASHPIQYQAPWFGALARAADVEVLYCHRQDAAGQAAAGFDHAFDWDIPLLEGYAHRWLKNESPVPDVNEFSGCDTPGIGGELERGRFDACLVNGWYLKSYVQAIQAARALGLPVLVRGDSQLKTPRPLVTRLAKYVPYRWFLSRIDAHLFVGQANREYLRHYGVPATRLFFAPHFVDSRRFAEGAASARLDGAAAAIRASCGVEDDDVVFLFVGKLIDKKRPHDFVDAVSRARATGVHVTGLIVGSGPLEADLRQRVADTGAPVRFLGFRNQGGLPACYAAADCLVLASDGRETWGLVVNEAMACGIPAIVSDAAGCAPDLITDGLTGYTYPCGDVAALADRLCLAAAARRSFTRAVLERIETYSCERAVAGTLEALAAVTDVRLTGAARSHA